MRQKFDLFNEKLQSLKNSDLFTNNNKSIHLPSQSKPDNYTHLENRLLNNENLFQTNTVLYDLKINILEDSLEKISNILEEEILFSTENTNNFIQEIQKTKNNYTQEIESNEDILKNLNEINQKILLNFNEKKNYKNELIEIKNEVEKINIDSDKDLSMLKEKENFNVKNQNESFLEIKNSVNNEMGNINKCIKEDLNKNEEYYVRDKNMISDIKNESKNLAKNEFFKRNVFKENIEKILDSTLYQVLENMTKVGSSDDNNF